MMKKCSKEKKKKKRGGKVSFKMMRVFGCF